MLTVTSENEELIVLADIVYFDIRIGGHYLLLWWQFSALLELEISDRSRQGEVAVDTTKVHETSCGLNTCLFGCSLSARSCTVTRIAYPHSVVCGRMTAVSRGP